MADSDIDQDYQLCQVLQRRHLFDKPIELLVKVRCRDGRLREVWMPKSKVVHSSRGRSLLNNFNKTKVGERGIDMYIGKRRSLSEKSKNNTGSFDGTNYNNNNNNDPNSWQLLKTSGTSSRVISNNSESTRKVKTRASISRKKLSSSSASRRSKNSTKNTGASKNTKQQQTRSTSEDRSKKGSSPVNPEERTVDSEVPLIPHLKCSNDDGGNRVKCSQVPSKTTRTRAGSRDIPPDAGVKTENSHPGADKSKTCKACGALSSTGRASACHEPWPFEPPSSSASSSSTHCSKCLCQRHGRAPLSTCCSTVADEASFGRRTSARQTEYAFRLREVTIRKFSCFVHLILGSETSNKRILKNSFDPKVFQEICLVLRNLARDDCRVVLLSGSGNAFSSGIDLTYLLESEQDRKTAAKNMAESLREFVDLLITFPKPIVAAVNGAATGLGAAILPLCDIVYASDKASFSCPYTTLAQTPEACSSHTFPSIMGPAMANELLLRGRKITALEAHQAGLITQVFWPENLMGEVMPRVQNLAQQSPKAVEFTKALMRSQAKGCLESVNRNECRLLAERWSTTECQKAIRNFLDSQVYSV